VYFHTFVERATAHGLRYLGESRITTMVTGNFGAEVQKTLSLLAADQIQTEQYLDFVRNRMFRETLLVRAEQTPDWAITPDRLYGLHVASPGKPLHAPVDLASGAPVQFESRSGMTVSAANPICKAAMVALSEAWPGTVPYVELLRVAASRIGREPTNEDLFGLAAALLNVYVSSDLIELHAAPVSFARTAGEKPVALAHVRACIAEGHATVANRRHEPVRLSDFARRLTPLLDGTRDRAMLADAMTALAVAGQMAVDKAGERLTDPVAIRTSLFGALDPTLAMLARDSLLER
jgi:hypothetical protein